MADWSDAGVFRRITPVTSAPVEKPIEIEPAGEIPVEGARLFPPNGADERSARDVAVFNRMLAGTIGVEEGMRAIAHSGGFPLRTANGYLFAHPAGEVDDVWLIGDHTGWGARPQKMRHDGGLFWTEVPIDSKAAQPRYKLKVAVGGRTEDIADPWARNYTYDDRGYEMSLVRATGAHYERYLSVSDGNVETTLRAFVPVGPIDRILYGHDGQNLFNPRGPFGGWRLDEAVGPNTMIVGIDHPPDRIGSYTHDKNWRFVRSDPDDPAQGEWREIGGKGSEYAKFCNRTVVDFIERRYKKPKIRGLIGSSLGATAAFQQLEDDPGRFDLIAFLSGTFGWGRLSSERRNAAGEVLEKRTSQNETLIERARHLDLRGHRPILVFYSGGTHGVNGPGKPHKANDNYEETLEMASVFQEVHGYEWDRDLFHAHAPGRPHGEIPWAEYVAKDQPIKNPVGIFEALG